MILTGVTAALAITGVVMGLRPDSGAALTLGTGQQGPGIEVWSSQELFREGEPIRVWLRTAADAYVAVLHVDPDGIVHILYPHFPWERSSAPSEREIEIVDPTSGTTPYAIRASEYPGLGYLFAVASGEPLDFSSFVQGNYWSYQSIADHGRIKGDPYVAFMRIVEQMSGGHPVQYDVFPYRVGTEQSFPRFLCYDCHGYADFESWNPYERECSNYRVVIFDAPHYYPARAYPASRVVYADSPRLQPRFVFTARQDGDAQVTLSTMPASDLEARRSLSPVTGEDFRQRGNVPVPMDRRSVWQSLIEWVSVDRSRDSTGVAETPTAVRQVEPQDLLERLRPRLQRRIPNSRTGVRVRRPPAVRPP